MLLVVKASSDASALVPLIRRREVAEHALLEYPHQHRDRGVDVVVNPDVGLTMARTRPLAWGGQVHPSASGVSNTAARCASPV
jgi:hypothetical protein